MSKLTVLQTWRPTAAEEQFATERWPNVNLVMQEELTAAELSAVLPDVDAVVGYIRTFPRGRVAEATRLRLIHVLGHGVDNLLTTDDLEHVRRRGVVVARANPAAVCIAEYVVMSMIALNRRLIRLHRSLVEQGDWSVDLWARRGEGVIGGELYGSTLGIVGYGHIGREVRARAAAFRMRIGAVSRDVERLAGEGLDFAHPWEELDEFLGRCDHVVLTLPLNGSTRHLLDRERIARMRPGAFVINVSRGPLVDEEALWEALTEGRLGGAALDVFEVEEAHERSRYPTQRPFGHLNVLLTPHIAGATAEARWRALEVIGDNLRHLAAGTEIVNAARPDELVAR